MHIFKISPPSQSKDVFFFIRETIFFFSTHTREEEEEGVVCHLLLENCSLSTPKDNIQFLPIHQ